MRDGPLEKWWGEVGWGKSQKNVSSGNYKEKIYIPTDFGQKNIYAQGGSVQVRLLEINYEVIDKSRLEIKHDFFKINMTHE